MFPTFEAYISDRNIQVAISFLVSLFISISAIPIIINISGLRDLLVNPIKRSSHKIPTSPFGGIAIFAGTVIGFLVWENQGEESLMHKLLAGIVILFFLGMKDDLYALSAFKKISSQIVASLIVIFGADLRIDSFFGIFGVYDIPYVISIAITIFLFVSLINAINLIDGIDGLAGGIGMLAALGFGLWFLIHSHYSLASLAFSLAGSLMGFLRFNFSVTNKTFMGDTGSLIIGFILTVFAVKFINLNTAFPLDATAMYTAPIIAIFVLMVPIFDTLRVFTKRMIMGRSPFKADRNHMHHLMIDNGMSHPQATFLLCSATLVFTLSAYFSRSFFSNTQLAYIVIGLYASYWFFADYMDGRRIKLKRQQKDIYPDTNFQKDLTNINNINTN